MAQAQCPGDRDTSRYNKRQRVQALPAGTKTGAHAPAASSPCHGTISYHIKNSLLTLRSDEEGGPSTKHRAA